MSRTSRSIPYYLKKRADEDYDTWNNPAMVTRFKRFDAKLGRDGSVKTSTCMYDASHPSVYNSWDDLASGKGKRGDKRMASHARRRYGKDIVDADVLTHNFEYDEDIAEQLAFDRYYADTQLQGFDFDHAAAYLEDERFNDYDSLAYEVRDYTTICDNDNYDYYWDVEDSRYA